jgi:MFS family permease
MIRLPRPVLINRDYTRLWFGQAVSSLGDVVFGTTLVLWIATRLAAGQSWAPVAVSGVMLSTGAAVLLTGPLAGVFVDRWNRRSTMLGTEVLRGALALALAALSFVPQHSLPTWAWLAVIYPVIFVLTVAGQFFNPARFAMIGDVATSEEDRARAASIGQTTSATVAIIGPPLAAPLLFTVGPQWALLFNAASYVVSYLAIRSVRAGRKVTAEATPAPRTGLRRDFVDGLRYFARHEFLAALLLVCIIATCSAGAINTLNVFFVTRNLHLPGSLYGYLGTAVGVGSICGALCAGRVVRWLGKRAAVSAGQLLAGVFIIVYSRQTSLLGAAIVFFLLAFPLAVINTAMTPLLLGAMPSEYRGRVMAVFNPGVQLGSMLAVVVAGWLAGSELRSFHATLAGQRFGTIDVIYAGSGVLMIVAAAYSVFALRSAAGKPESSAEAAPAPAASP